MDFLRGPNVITPDTSTTGGVSYHSWMDIRPNNISSVSCAVGDVAPTESASAALEVSSTTKGVVFPRMTKTERDAIATPATGLVVYNTTSNALNVYNGAWQALDMTADP